MTHTQTLYESLGAEVGIRTAVDQFYDRVVADPRLAAYFDGVDMIALRRHQVDMLSAATGGPEELHGCGDGRRARRTAHRRRGVRSGGRPSARTRWSRSACTGETITGVLGALSPLRSDIVTA